MAEAYKVVPFVDWNQIPWEPGRVGTERKIFAGKGVTIILSRVRRALFKPRPHSHNYEHIVYQISGDAEFHVATETYHLVPGSCLLVPAEVSHYGIPLTDEFINMDAMPVEPGDIKIVFQD